MCLVHLLDAWPQLTKHVVTRWYRPPELILQKVHREQAGSTDFDELVGVIFTASLMGPAARIGRRLSCVYPSRQITRMPLMCGP